MTPLFKKLNYKTGKINCINLPKSVKSEIYKMSEFTEVKNKISPKDKIDFILIFVASETEIEQSIKKVHDQLTPDSILWYCYPKQSSKNYKSSINRDQGWKTLGKYDFEGVRQVAIDDDWSALRFKKVATIKSITRDKSMLLSESAKEVLKPKVVEIPKELQAVFKSNQRLKNTYDGMSYTCRKEYALYISEAKKEETRMRRIEKIIPMILAGKNFS